MTPEDKVIFDQAIAAGSTLESSNLDATKVEASSTKVESSTPKVESDFLKQRRSWTICYLQMPLQQRLF